MNVIVVAGGRGRRFGGDVPKQFVMLGDQSMLRVTVGRFTGIADLARVIVVAAPEEHGRCRDLLAPLGLPLRMAPAGPERQQSVAAGVAVLDEECEIALVHDAARPLVPAADVAACIAAARATGAAILATPVADTVKRVRDATIVATVPRDDLWLAQTPQAFRASILRRAHAEGACTAGATDDAALVERLGVPVAIVPGDPINRKITTPEDLAWAASVLARAAG